MLNLVLKSGDSIKIGDDIVIKLQSERRAQLVIDAPKDVNIKRMPAGQVPVEKKSAK